MIVDSELRRSCRSSPARFEFPVDSLPKMIQAMVLGMIMGSSPTLAHAPYFRLRQIEIKHSPPTPSAIMLAGSGTGEYASPVY